MEEKDLIITNFSKFIKETDDLLDLLINNFSLCKIIIYNDLLWKNINIITKRYNCNKILEIIKLLYKIDNNLINENMYSLFENTRKRVL